MAEMDKLHDQITKLKGQKLKVEEKLHEAETKRLSSAAQHQFDVAYAKYKKEKERLDREDEEYSGVLKYYAEQKRQIEAKFKRAQMEYESALETVKQQETLSYLKHQRKYNPQYEKTELAEAAMKSAEAKLNSSNTVSVSEQRLKGMLEQLDKQIEQQQQILDEWKEEMKSQKKPKAKQNGSEGS